MSLNEFHEMIDQAKDDKTNGRVVFHEELKKRISHGKYRMVSISRKTVVGDLPSLLYLIVVRILKK